MDDFCIFNFWKKWLYLEFYFFNIFLIILLPFFKYNEFLN